MSIGNIKDYYDEKSIVGQKRCFWQRSFTAVYLCVFDTIVGFSIKKLQSGNPTMCALSSCGMSCVDKVS